MFDVIIRTKIILRCPSRCDYLRCADLFFSTESFLMGACSKEIERVLPAGIETTTAQIAGGRERSSFYGQ